MTKLVLEVDVDGASEDIEVLQGALSPEHREEFPGVETQLERTTEGSARLTITGDHVPNVRAAMNAHLRWIATIEDVLAVDPDHTKTEVL